MTPRVPILLYHEILPTERCASSGGLGVSVDQFREDMERLSADGWRCLAAEEAAELALAGRKSARCFALTFDDGFRDFAELAHPVLRRLGFTATVFVVTDRIGGRADWTGAAGRPLLSADEIHLLARDGIEFGSHSRTHERLPDCSGPRLLDELRGSRESLSEIVGREVGSIAWPYGESDGRTRRAAGQVGYRLGFGVAGGGPLLQRVRAALRPSARDRFAVARREVRGEDGLLRRRVRMGAADGVFVSARKLAAFAGRKP
ncbi:MAG: polysaccharide deacetylase family protein [Gemmatimonadota bacterium]